MNNNSDRYTWSKLKNMRCPVHSCGGKLEQNYAYQNVYSCQWCMFQISGSDLENKIYEISKTTL